MSEKAILTRQPRGKVIGVMVAWNTGDLLMAAVESAVRALAGEGELLMVDNASTDGSVERVRQRFPQLAILKMPENLGGAGGFNAGAFVATQCIECEYVWLLDSDIFVEDGALLPLLACLKSNSQAAAAGSQICMYQQPDIIQEMGAGYSAVLGSLRPCHAGEARFSQSVAAFSVDYLAACSLLVRAEAIAKHGLFGDFFIFYDDVEWGLRMREARWSLLAVPASVIRHQFSGLKPMVVWREYYRKRNRAACLTLHPPKKSKLFLVWLYLAFLNYLTFVYRRLDYGCLGEVYGQALDDYLQCQMGKRVVPQAQASATLPDFSGVGRITIDTPRAGDSLAVITQLARVYPGTVFRLAKPSQRRTLLALGLPELLPSHTQTGVEIAIVGEWFGIATLLRRGKIYRYCQGHYEPLLHPGRTFLHACGLRLVGAIVGATRATLQLPGVVRQYADQSPYRGLFFDYELAESAQATASDAKR